MTAAIRSADAPCVERLTTGEAAELLQNLAASRDTEVSITIPDCDLRIADLAGSARRATAESLRPGKIENEKKLTDQPTKDNPFRFESFYYDSGVKQYDMRARNYRPEIGRFTSQDRYESASKDFNLQADPLTQNCYAFAGGNPVNRVEFDGHDVIDAIGLDDERDDAKDAVEEGAKKVKNEFDEKSNNPKAEFGKGVVDAVVETGDALAHPRRTREGLRKAGETFAKDPRRLDEECCLGRRQML